MSLGFNISVDVGIDFSRKNLEALLNRGSRLGFRYGSIHCKEADFARQEICNIRDFKTTFHERFAICSLTFDFQDTCASLVLSKSSRGTIKLQMWDFCSSWVRTYVGIGREIDLPRYLSLAVDLCEPFGIERVRLFRDYFDEYSFERGAYIF